MENNNKNSVIEDLKTKKMNFNRWYNYVYLYSNVQTRLNLNECITFLSALLECKVIVNDVDENQKYQTMCNQIQTRLNMFKDLKELTPKTNKLKKTKI